MTQEEALKIIKNAKPIVLPTTKAVGINEDKKITSFKDFFRNGNKTQRRTIKMHDQEG